MRKESRPIIPQPTFTLDALLAALGAMATAPISDGYRFRGGSNVGDVAFNRRVTRRRIRNRIAKESRRRNWSACRRQHAASVA